MASSTSNFTIDPSHVEDGNLELCNCGFSARRWTCRQGPNRGLDFWGRAAYKGYRNPGCGYFKWVEDAKNIEFRLKKIKNHLVTLEKKMDEVVKLVKIFGVMIIIILM